MRAACTAISFSSYSVKVADVHGLHSHQLVRVVVHKGVVRELVLLVLGLYLAQSPARPRRRLQGRRTTSVKRRRRPLRRSAAAPGTWTLPV